MVWSASQTFPGDSNAPGEARRFCADELGAAIGHVPGSRTAISTAQLITSELVTNAVNAGSDSIDVTLRLSGDRLRIVVGDDAPSLPEMADSRPRDDHGRGLPIVDALSLRWGYERRGSTKNVWAEFVVAKGTTERRGEPSRGGERALG